jgi:hypothetical protein
VFCIYSSTPPTTVSLNHLSENSNDPSGGPLDLPGNPNIFQTLFSPLFFLGNFVFFGRAALGFNFFAAFAAGYNDNALMVVLLDIQILTPALGTLFDTA